MWMTLTASVYNLVRMAKLMTVPARGGGARNAKESRDPAS